MLKVLITGGTGFIGRNLVEQLSCKIDKYRIFSPTSSELNLLEDKKVFDYIKINKFDIIIHSAVYDAVPKHSIKNPSKVLENNLRMFFNIARCKNYFNKMIYFGSGAEFDRENWIPKMDETYFDEHIPSDHYGLSKYIMTKYTYLSNNIYNLRLFAVFGKYDDWRVRIISNICHNTILNQPIIINQNKYYDFLYIDDLIRIVEWFIHNTPKSNVYNICSGNVIDFKTIITKIMNISGKLMDIKIKTDDLGIEYSGDNKIIMNELKQFKYTPFDNSIKSLYDWFEHNKFILEETQNEIKY